MDSRSLGVTFWQSPGLTRQADRCVGNAVAEQLLDCLSRPDEFWIAIVFQECLGFRRRRQRRLCAMLRVSSSSDEITPVSERSLRRAAAKSTSGL